MANCGENQLSTTRTTCSPPLRLTQANVLLNDAQQRAVNENENETQEVTVPTGSGPTTQCAQIDGFQADTQQHPVVANVSRVQTSTAEMETQGAPQPAQTHWGRGTYGARRRQNRADLQAERESARMEVQEVPSSSYASNADPNWLPPYQRQYQRDDGDGTWTYDRQGSWWKCAWSEESGWSDWAPSVEEDAPQPKRPCQAE